MWGIIFGALIIKLIFDAVTNVIAAAQAEQMYAKYKQVRNMMEGKNDKD